jgi:type VI secretion system secreted protein VgrG
MATTRLATQANQQAQLSSPLGADALLLAKFVAVERLSEPFEIVAEVLAEQETDFMPHLGAAFGIKLEDAGEAQARAFHGVLFEAMHLGDDDEGVRYRLTLRPWLSLLATGLNTRLFQNKSAVAIIEAVFKEAGFSGYQFAKVNKGRAAREYCVQYRESDFAFVSRLLEEEGLYYFFKHEDGGHTLTVVDGPAGHDAAPGAEKAHYYAEGSVIRPDPHIWAWGERVRPGVQKVSLRDSHFAKPFDPYAAEQAAKGDGDNDKAEFYDYPGGYGWVRDDGGETGAATAQLRLDAGRAQRRTLVGRGDVFAFATGAKVTIEGHPYDAYNQEVLITEAVHTYHSQAYRSGGGGGGGVGLEVSVEAIPYATTWRTPLRTPRPVVGGPQTALVVGPEGEVIHVDKYGRIRVQFYWDRAKGRKADQRSCWVRVSQGWADGGFGAIHLPRVGEEVVVDFLEGDPDRPLVTGRVYNAERMPPYALPGEKTKSGWKSQTVGAAGTYTETEEPPKSNERASTSCVSRTRAARKRSSCTRSGT